MNYCIVLGCITKVHAKNLCTIHYMRMARRGTTDRHVHVPIFKKCGVASCELKAKSLGYCIFHYDRVKHGREIDSPVRDRSYRRAIIEGNIAKIPLGVNAKDGYAIVDKEFVHLDKYKWILGGHYAQTKEDGRPIFMHIMIKGKAPKGLATDHINRNKLDNRLSNLRHCSYSLNTVNKGLQSNNTTGYKGVHLQKSTGHYYAVIKRDHILYHIGTFGTLKEAIEARSVAEKIYHSYE